MKQKDVAAEFDVPANTVSTIMKKKDHYRELYFSGQTDSLFTLMLELYLNLSLYFYYYSGENKIN